MGFTPSYAVIDFADMAFNSQLLDLLLEVNDSHGIPPYLRYDIRSPTPSESSVPALEPDIVSRRTLEIENARAALGEAKTELMTGQISPNSYRHIESALNETLHKSISLSELNSMSHTTLETIPRDDLPHDLGDSLPAGYLSMEHEEEYLATLDAALGGTIQPRPESHPIRSNERDKDVSLRNPVSVYNWLRKHQPQVFLQDSDSSPEKPPPKLTSTAKASKRSSIAPKQEAQVLDDEGYLVSGIAEGSSRSKRKRDDEPYRPKGGSSRPSKRKKISGGNTERKDTGEEEGL